MRPPRLRLLPTALVVSLVSLCARADLPYTPVQLLSTVQQGQQLVYILDPPSTSSPNGGLRLLKPTSTLVASSPAAQTLSSSLPFLGQGSSPAYSASTSSNGTINVVVGDCSQGPSSASVWSYTLDARGRGSWTQLSVSGASDGTNNQAAVNYLAQSISFSPTSASNSSIYTFGGMCPTAGATDSNWVSAASYSNQLVALQPDSASAFDFTLGTARGQPIAEAGFSITPLSPSYSNNTDGSQSTSQSFLLLGGQTQDAFINMSTVALFSLPQASWSFMPVTATDGKTDLRIRDSSTQVEPRSGHTAVLTSDGSRVIMFGGWVGDTSSPADPQLAILDVGAGFGGSTGWAWADEPSQPSFPQGSSGLYGHGAAMLDGDVMMVYGGLSIPTDASSSSKKKKKRAASSANDNALYYNVSSNEWLTSYDPNLVPAPQTSGAASTSQNLSSQQQVGLGVGLSFGFVALASAAIFAYGVIKRYQRQDAKEDEKIHEDEINDLGATANAHHEKPLSPSELDTPGRGALAGQIWDGRGRVEDEPEVEASVWRGDSIRDAERTGVDLDVPSPQRGLRRSLASRHGRTGSRRRASGCLPPIAPIEEEQDEGDPRSETVEDPFKDPEPGQALGMLPHHLDVSGPTFGQQMRQMNEWISDLAALAQDQPDPGRESPDKSDRTLSSLSNGSCISRASEASATSSAALRGAQPAFAATRPPASSLRIIPIGLNPFAGGSPLPSPSPTHLREGVSPGPNRRNLLVGPLTSESRGNDADSFTTAHTTFVNLQAESDALLGPVRPGQASNLHFLEPDEEPTFTRANGRRAPSSRIGGWVGSVRRVIHSAGRSTNMALTGMRSPDARDAGPSGLGGLIAYYETRGSAASSPTKQGGARAPGQTSAEELDGGHARPEPRRSASVGAEPWMMKRGAKDWGVESRARRRSIAGSPERPWAGSDESGSAEHEPRRGRARVGGPDADDDDDDWDVEAAAEERNVQVMFSVPKERLRVVNADIEDASISDAGDPDGDAPRRRS